MFPHNSHWCLTISLFVSSPIAVLLLSFLCSGFTSPLSHLFSFIALFVIMCFLWCLMDQSEDPYADRTYACNFELHQHCNLELYPLQKQAYMNIQPASVAQLDAPSDWRPGGRGFNPRRGRQHSFVEIDHEIFSTVILSLPLIQEGQLSVSGERMCTILVNRLED